MILLRLILGGLWKLLQPLLGPLIGYAKGIIDTRRKVALDAARDTVDALETRERIEDEIEQDGNLVDRAKRAGLVRRDGH